MALRQPDPAAILKQSRDRTLALAAQAGGSRARAMLERAQKDLARRLREAEGLRGPGAGSFSAVQMRATLAQMRAVLRQLQVEMLKQVKAGAKEAAEQETRTTVQYLASAEQQFRGLARPLAIREAALLDKVSAGTEASVLRRLGGDPSAPQQQGILNRYGMSTVESFEGVLQQRFLQGMPWAEARAQLIDESPFLQGAPAHWAERILRTETMAAHGRAAWESIRGANAELGDMVKIISCTFDSRTGADSYAVHGQIRRPEEAFDSWFGQFMHPPDRPNDRGVVVPHRLSWPIPRSLMPRSEGEVRARWAAEGRKGSPPARPLLSTIDRALFGRAA